MPKLKINLPMVLWLAIWGGMFTGIETIQNPQLFSHPAALFQGIRALLPFMALYLGLMWIFISRLKFPPFLTPLGLFFYYSVVGIIISFLSRDVAASLFWGLLYMAPILVMWIITTGDYSVENMRMILYSNYLASGMIFFALFFEVYRTGNLGRNISYYDLPFGIGRMIANGVGRFALIVIIICVVRFLHIKNKIRYALALIVLPAGYLLIQTQSRTSLLGLGVVSALFVIIQGLRWQFLFLGPASAYVIWVSGYQRRAQQRMDMLFRLSGRETTWTEAVDLIKQSPFLGWGFHSDRIMLQGAHIHNSYIHAMLQSGILGFILFVAGLLSIWYVILSRKILSRIKSADALDRPCLIESILLVGFLSARSFFESTAAFFGIDLLILIPAIAYIYIWSEKDKGMGMFS